MTKQELIIEKIQKCCDDAIDCDDNCMFFSEEYDECIFRVLGLEFEKIVEYDYEPSEDELEADYNDWLSRFVVGGWEREE